MDEKTGVTGVAHVLEHMMFKGTKAVPVGEFSRRIAAAGGRENAFTSYDYTAYFQQLHKSQLELAMKLEEIARNDPYFVERNLYPNVDFYSGIILKAIGIPASMFTVIFATGRTPGWIAHWNEMISGPYKIGRPRQLYTGSKKRDYPA
jgi:hypothetical protein